MYIYHKTTKYSYIDYITITSEMRFTRMAYLSRGQKNNKPLTISLKNGEIISDFYIIISIFIKFYEMYCYR